MDVEHAAVPALHEFGREQAHEAGKADQVDAVLVERRLQLGLERRAILAERLVFDAAVGDAGVLSPCASPAASARLEITTTISAG